MAIDEPGEHGEQAQHRFAGTVNAPEFPPGLEWINTDRPLRLADLRGKLVRQSAAPRLVTASHLAS